MMDVDDLMMVMILGGIALCGAYFRAQYMDWRNQQTAEVQKTIRLRLLYPDYLSRRQVRVVVHVVDLAGVRANTSIPEAVETTGSGQTLPLRNAA
jgi:hypothetical protein